MQRSKALANVNVASLVSLVSLFGVLVCTVKQFLEMSLPSLQPGPEHEIYAAFVQPANHKI